MTPIRLIIVVFTIDFLLLLITWYCCRAVKHAFRKRDLMTEKLHTATTRFAKTRESLLDANNTLRLQLEKAEASWGDAQANLQFRDKQITDLCQLYKKLKTAHQDLKVKYNQVVGQYNSLLSKMPTDGDMPV